MVSGPEWYYGCLALVCRPINGIFYRWEKVYDPSTHSNNNNKHIRRVTHYHGRLPITNILYHQNSRTRSYFLDFLVYIVISIPYMWYHQYRWRCLGNIVDIWNVVHVKTLNILSFPFYHHRFYCLYYMVSSNLDI